MNCHFWNTFLRQAKTDQPTGHIHNFCIVDLVSMSHDQDFK